MFPGSNSPESGVAIGPNLEANNYLPSECPTRVFFFFLNCRQLAFLFLRNTIIFFSCVSTLFIPRQLSLSDLIGSMYVNIQIVRSVN